MKNRLVLFFALFCLLQLPIYVIMGRGPIGFDMSIKSAERGLMEVPKNKDEVEAIRRHLEDAESSLATAGQVSDSRTARLNLNRALLAWHEGRVLEADGFFRKAIEQFEATHGPDSFHTSAVSLRYAEFLMLTRRYEEALPRFSLGVKSIEDTLGPKNPFAVRMVFRRAALLTYMGRQGEAVEVAGPYLAALQEQAGRFDELYLGQTASVLDTLARSKVGLPAAPGGQGWRTALLKAHNEGKQRLAEFPEEG
jgi:tetratricopeptide (TPR) repeat protein